MRPPFQHQTLNILSDSLNASLRSELKEPVRSVAWMQAFKGVVTLGFTKAVRYAVNKIRKGLKRRA